MFKSMAVSKVEYYAAEKMEGTGSTMQLDIQNHLLSGENTIAKEYS